MQRIQAEDEPDEVRLRSNIREISWLFGESTRHECRPSKSSARYARANLSERVEVIFRKSFLLEKVLTRVSSLIGLSYGIAKEKGGVQMGRGPSTKPLRK